MIGNTAVLESIFTFDPAEYIDKAFLFDLRKTSEEKIFDRLLENIPDGNDKYYTKHTDGTNVFRIRTDERQPVKDLLIKLIENTDRKLAGQKIAPTFCS